MVYTKITTKRRENLREKPRKTDDRRRERKKKSCGGKNG
jgi:hypothetical protein